jgi:hypothetical protein
VDLAGEHVSPSLDGTPKQRRLARLDRIFGERGCPDVGGPLDAVCLAVEPLLCVGRDVDGLGVVDGLQVGPGECAEGRGAVISDEERVLEASG